MNAPTMTDLYLARIFTLEAAYNQERDRADRAEQALSNLIHDACGGEVVIPAGSLKDARPLQWYTADDGKMTVMCVCPDEVEGY